MITQMANNQIVEINNNEQKFYSYSSLIATKKNNKTVLTNKWDYSRTTTKYLCRFLGVKSKKDIEKMILNKEITIE